MRSALICPVCWDTVQVLRPEEGSTITTRRGRWQDVVLSLQPCGHRMTKLMSQMVCRADVCTRTLTVVP